MASSQKKVKKKLIPFSSIFILHLSFILSLYLSLYTSGIIGRADVVESFSFKCWDAWTQKSIFHFPWFKKKEYIYIRMGKGNDSAFRMNASSRELDGKPISPRKRPTTALHLHLVFYLFFDLVQIKIWKNWKMSPFYFVLNHFPAG